MGQKCVRQSAVLPEKGKPFQVIETKVAEGKKAVLISPAKGLIVKVECAAICPSEIRIQEGELDCRAEQFIPLTPDSIKYPLVLGHEISGRVFLLGDEPADADLELTVGDRVCVYPWMACMDPDCGACRVDRQNICPKAGENILGIHSDGGYSSFVSVPLRKFAVRVPDRIPLEVACMLPCSGVTAYNAVTAIMNKILEVTRIKGFSSLLLVGTIGVGLWCLQIARSILPETTRIICADITEERLNTARENGADATILWNEDRHNDLVTRTCDKSLDGGVDAAIDTVNSSTTAEWTFECLNKNGVQICTGMLGNSMSIPLTQLVQQQKTVIGVTIGSLLQLKELIGLLDGIEFKPPPIEHVNLDQIQETFDKLREGPTDGRMIIRHGQPLKHSTRRREFDKLIGGM